MTNWTNRYMFDKAALEVIPCDYYLTSTSVVEWNQEVQLSAIDGANH